MSQLLFIVHEPTFDLCFYKVGLSDVCCLVQHTHTRFSIQLPSACSNLDEQMGTSWLAHMVFIPVSLLSSLDSRRPIDRIKEQA